LTLGEAGNLTGVFGRSVDIGVLAPTTAVARVPGLDPGIDPRVHPLRMEHFAKKMDCRVIRAFTPVFERVKKLSSR
jgi:thioredoxin reductase